MLIAKLLFAEKEQQSQQFIRIVLICLYSASVTEKWIVVAHVFCQ